MLGIFKNRKGTNLLYKACWLGNVFACHPPWAIQRWLDSFLFFNARLI